MSKKDLNESFQYYDEESCKNSAAYFLMVGGGIILATLILILAFDLIFGLGPSSRLFQVSMLYRRGSQPGGLVPKGRGTL
jgi:hypothetical protein